MLSIASWSLSALVLCGAVAVEPSSTVVEAPVEPSPKGDAKPEGKAKPGGDAKPEGKAKPEGDAKPEGKAKPEGDAKPEGKAKPEGDAKPQGAAADESGSSESTGGGAGAASGADTESGSEATGSSADAEPSGADAGADASATDAAANDDVSGGGGGGTAPVGAGSSGGGGGGGAAPTGASGGGGGGTSPGSISGGGGGSKAGASGGGSKPGGPVASGSVRSDDDDYYDEGEAELEDDRSSRRARRRERRREGQWQVFAPYPELGTIRYRDPEQRRTIWLGLDASGVYLPQSWGLFDRTVWTVRPAGSWALALTPWLAIGGRHSVAWYDAQNIRTRVHAHQVELSGRPLAGSRPDVALDDRLSAGVSMHAIRWTEVGALGLKPGGLEDTIVHLGYGLDHLLGTRWRLGWQAQVRYAWVYQDTQRHARLSTRLAFNPRPAHRLSAAAVGYYVNRDEEQLGNPLPRHSLYGQFGLGYAWVANAGLGPWFDVRYNTGFMSGEAPVYEIREEALNTDYGEVLVGMMARWQ